MRRRSPRGRTAPTRHRRDAARNRPRGYLRYCGQACRGRVQCRSRCPTATAPPDWEGSPGSSSGLVAWTWVSLSFRTRANSTSSFRCWSGTPNCETAPGKTRWSPCGQITAGSGGGRGFHAGHPSGKIDHASITPGHGWKCVQPFSPSHSWPSTSTIGPTSSLIWRTWPMTSQPSGTLPGSKVAAIA